MRVKFNLRLFYILIVGIIIGVFICLIITYLFTFKPVKQDNEKLKLLMPLFSSIIASISLVVATRTFETNIEISNRNQILELIRLNLDILKSKKIQTIGQEIMKDIEKEFNDESFKINVVLNNGSRAYYNFLNTKTNCKKNILNKENIIDNLSVFSFTKDSYYEKYKLELISLLESNKKKDMLKLWVNINYLCGSSAVKYNIISSSKQYEVESGKFEQNIIISKFYSETLFKKNRFTIHPLIKFHSDVDYDNIPVNYFEVFDLCNSVFKNNYTDISHFFRTFHRTIKTINRLYKKGTEDYKEYIGILRAQIPDAILLLLFYNAVYTEKGIGMARELVASDFFGNFNDITIYTDKNNRNSIEIRSEHLISDKRFINIQDIYIAKTIFSFNKESKKLLKSLKNNSIKIKKDNLFVEKDNIFYYYENLLCYMFEKEFSKHPKLLNNYRQI